MGSCKHCYRDSDADHAEEDCPVLATEDDSWIDALEAKVS